MIRVKSPPRYGKIKAEESVSHLGIISLLVEGSLTYSHIGLIPISILRLLDERLWVEHVVGGIDSVAETESEKI